MGIEDFWGDGEMYFIKFSTLDNELVKESGTQNNGDGDLVS